MRGWNDWKNLQFYFQGLGSFAFGAEPLYLEPEITWDIAQEIQEAIAQTNLVDALPPLAEAGTDQKVLFGTSVQFNASGSSDDLFILGYEWDFSVGTIGTGVTVSHQYETLEHTL